MNTLGKRTLAALAVSLALTGVAAAQPYAPPPYPAVPVPRVEQIPPPPPGRPLVWEPGHWHWNGAAYVWLAGHYIVGRPHWHAYVPGYWAHRGPGWVWIPAHWQ